MEITSSRVSVFEVVLNLNHWDAMTSRDIPGFAQRVMDLIPTTARHKCIAGTPGGFHAELVKGTNFGHVVEHVLLELVHLADTEAPEYTGWTKSLGNGRYVIHYGAPDFLTGRLAAILAVEIVRDLQRGQTPDLDQHIANVQHPRAYFSRTNAAAIDLWDGAESETDALVHEPVPTLTGRQLQNLSNLFALVRPDFPALHHAWALAFQVYGGDFARGIQDKVELIHPDRSFASLSRGDYTTYFNGVTNFCRMMRTLRIPLNFVSHAAWLYKNMIQVAILDRSSKETETQNQAIGDLDDFYQNIFHSILQGYTTLPELATTPEDVTVCSFRARQVRQDTVLVVDDDVMARRVARNILEHHDLNTQGARNGIEALHILAEEEAGIGLVILDLVMPGTPGEVVCQQIRHNHPHLKIILCSGFSIDNRYRQCLVEREVCFLAKPFGVQKLVDLVRELMDLKIAGTAAGR